MIERRLQNFGSFVASLEIHWLNHSITPSGTHKGRPYELAGVFSSPTGAR